MRVSSILSLLIAIALGGTAAFLAKGVLQTRAAGAGSGPETRTAVVAAQPISFGAQLTADNLHEIAWPSANVPDGTFSTIAEIIKDGRRLALTPLQPNEPILQSKITGPNQRATLSTLIEEGMRAVSVRVDEVRGVAGFVLPGDRVDVILTRGENPNSADPKSAAYADLLLQNAKVLGIDQVTNERQDKPTVAKSVTLEVSMEQAQKVVLAQGVGRLSLVLRQAGPGDPIAARRVTAADLSGGEVVQARNEGDDRNAQLEKRLEELRKSAEQASARDREAALQRIAELEARLQAQPIQPPRPEITAAAAVSAPPQSTVNVVRNANKREQYTVSPER